MRLVSVLFSGRQPAAYRRMARVLALSATEHSPATPLSIVEVTEPPTDINAVASRHCKTQWRENARKSKHHNRIVQEEGAGGWGLGAGEVIGFLDIDMLVMGDLSPIERYEFDVAYTVRPAGSRWKLNTGVYFVRCLEAGRRFMAAWNETVYRMLADPVLHQQWRVKLCYGGIHQAALGYLVESRESRVEGVRLLELPCAEWNAVSGVWNAEAPRVVHLMGQLRCACFGRCACRDPKARRWVEAWQRYDRQGSEVAA